MATENPGDGVHKAAVLLRSLPKSQRTRLLKRIEAAQAEAVANEMNRLGILDQSEQKAIVREFAKASGAKPKRPRPRKHAPFEFLREMPTDALLDLIADEQPQTIATILSYLPPRQTAAVLEEMGVEEQMSIVWRIATLGEVDPETIRDVEKALERRLSTGASSSSGHRGIGQVVQILGIVEPAVERRILSELAETDPELHRAIRRAMFGVDVAPYGEQEMLEAAG